MKEPYTVYAVFEDNCQRYTAFVDAVSPEDAEKKAMKKAVAPIIVAGVVKGYVAPVDGNVATDITPIYGRGYETLVSRVVTTNEHFHVPFHCLKCRADLRKSNALRQLNFTSQAWPGRVPRGTYVGDRWGVVLNDDHGPVETKGPRIIAAQLVCESCGATIWNGVRDDGPDRHPRKRK